MDGFLIVQRGDDIGRRVDLNADQLTIGRGTDNDVTLNDPMVSRYHAVLKRQGGQYILIDLGSSNPVVINDQGLEPGVPRQLTHRDVLFIGRTVFSFQSRGSAGGTAQQSAPSRSAATPPPVMERESHPPLASAGHTQIVPQQGAVAAPREHDKTMIGGDPEPLTPPPPHFAPPPPPVRFDDEAPTNAGVMIPQGDRMIGQPPSEDEGDLPTQIIPRR